MDSPKIKLTRDSILQITALLGEEDDEQLKLDTLEGETDLFEVISMLLDNIEAAEDQVEILGEQAARRKTRASRLLLKIEQMKGVIQSLMESAGVKKIPLPQATVFISQRKGGWKVVDEAQLTDEFVRHEVVTKPDRERIASAIEHNITVPGVLLTNAAPTLNIRRK